MAAVVQPELISPARGDAQNPPLLQNGDRLSSREFLRRYDAMPNLKKAELIEGVVYMGSPVSIGHAAPDSLVQCWLATYAGYTPGVQALVNATITLDAENTVQPDGLLRILPECGGRTRASEQNLLEGTPELVFEIAVSSASIDSRDKFRAFQRNQIPEYVIWLAAEKRIRWFHLAEQSYAELPLDAEGCLASRVFPGLVLPVGKMLALDTPGVLEALRQNIQEEAHQRFVRSLAEKREARF